MNTNYEILKKAIDDNTATFIVEKHSPAFLKDFEKNHSAYKNFVDNEYPIVFDCTLQYLMEQNNTNNNINIKKSINYSQYIVNSILITFDTTNWTDETTEFHIIMMGTLPVDEFLPIDKLEVSPKINEMLIAQDINNDIINKKVFAKMTDNTSYLMQGHQLRYTTIPTEEYEAKSQSEIINMFKSNYDNMWMGNYEKNRVFFIGVLLNEYYYDVLRSPIDVQREIDGFKININVEPEIINKYQKVFNKLNGTFKSEVDSTLNTSLKTLYEYILESDLSMHISKYVYLSYQHNIENQERPDRYHSQNFDGYMSKLIYKNPETKDEQIQIGNNSYDYFTLQYLIDQFKTLITKNDFKGKMYYTTATETNYASFQIWNQDTLKLASHNFVDKLLTNHPEILNTIDTTRQKFVQTQCKLLNHEPTKQLELTEQPHATENWQALKKLFNFHSNTHSINDLLGNLSSNNLTPKYYIDTECRLITKISFSYDEQKLSITQVTY